MSIKLKILVKLTTLRFISSTYNKPFRKNNLSKNLIAVKLYMNSIKNVLIKFLNIKPLSN